ncbi:MAG: 4Fe-4S binding protein [Desulfobulbaceae bacterium]|nr:4Fe-4S binding protein [Desulfobulbaceae bacterium]HIJ79036.1 4Fe-4S binding protein [Deltaproteobacteria bacterium]
MNTRIYVLKFPKEVIDQPIICHLVKKFDIEFNILKATILLQQEGVMVIEFIGHAANIKKGITYLKDLGVKVQSMAGNISRDEEKCYQCGACTGVCPTGALSLTRPEMAVPFAEDKCTACGLCVAVCPARAMTVSLNGNLDLAA